MTTVVRHAGGVLRPSSTTRRRITKGYAKSRVDYDARRRARTRSAEMNAMLTIVRSDPCSLSMLSGDCHPQMAADHIVSLERGGEDDWTNVSGVCRRHNAMKKERGLLEVLLDA